ncbi:glycosyltransferase [Paenibacillus sp. AK121]|uniref:glycosyltransferase family 2 protein n=1 Tax=Paenibacillus TaxID=44249 RepID=UPI001C237699|nr:glycosyltransferase [Paenibacillus sp. AK121]MBU9706508.1 glycosyltransferase [Paenibacillus sp. AK121]MEE4570970.1 glycosyltransferase [Paenibacillus polymyxa]
MNYKLSIIIPLYNAENFIRVAFASILNQTFGFQNLEIIMVNDASKDSTKEIINELASLYSNVVALHLNESSGAAGRPRNVGMEHATADYIMFLDQDDTYADNACEVLYRLVVNKNIDIGMATYRNVSEDNKIIDDCVLDSDFPLKINVDSIDQSEKLFYLSPSVWTKIFKKKFLEQNNIKFPEGIIGEDLVFITHAEMVANGILFEKKVIYNYLVREKEDKSLSHNYNKRFFEQSYYSIEEVFKIMKKYGRDKYFPIILESHLDHHLYMMFKSESLTKTEKMEVFKRSDWFLSKCNQYGVFPKSDFYKILFQKLVLNKYKEAIDFYNDSSFLIEKRDHWAKELSEGKNWLESQLENYKLEVKNQNQVIKELKEWNTKLIKDKEWFEDQIRNLKIEMNNQLQVLENFKKWNEELLEAKRWLEQRLEKNQINEEGS